MAGFSELQTFWREKHEHDWQTRDTLWRFLGISATTEVAEFLLNEAMVSFWRRCRLTGSWLLIRRVKRLRALGLAGVALSTRLSIVPLQESEQAPGVLLHRRHLLPPDGTRSKLVRSPAEPRDPPCRANPIAVFLGLLHLNLERALPPFGTIQRQPCNLVLRLRRLRIFDQVRLGRQGFFPRLLFDTTLLLREPRRSQTNSVHNRLRARTGLPCRLAPQFSRTNIMPNNRCEGA